MNLKIEVAQVRVRPGEPINVTVLLSNTSADHSRIVDTRPFNDFGQLISVIGPSGTRLISTVRSHGHHKLGELNLAEVPAGGFLGATVNLQKIFPPAPLDNPHNMWLPGKYQVSAVYRRFRGEDSNVERPASDRITAAGPHVDETPSRYWTGEVRSESVDIYIEDYSLAEKGKLKSDLETGTTGAKLAALQKVHLMGLTTLIPLIENLLNSDSSLVVRRSAAVVLHVMASPSSLKTFVKHLNSSDNIIRIEAALGVRRLWEDVSLRDKVKAEALAGLMVAADVDKFPTSYLAALRTLGLMGDESAIGLAKKALVVEKNPDFKYSLNDIIRDLQKIPR